MAAVLKAFCVLNNPLPRQKNLETICDSWSCALFRHSLQIPIGAFFAIFAGKGASDRVVPKRSKSDPRRESCFRLGEPSGYSISVKALLTPDSEGDK